MEFFKVIKGRRSVRSWTDKPVPKELIKKLIDSARWSPSSCNRQSCKFVIVESEKNKKILANSTPSGKPFCSDAPVIMIVLVDERLYNSERSEHTPYLDAAAAIENILLAAHDSELGACWLNFDTKSLGCDEKIRSAFNISKHFLIISLIALGYPKKIPEPPLRKEIDEFIINENFKDYNE